MTCETCKYVFDKTVHCSFNLSNDYKEMKRIKKELEQTIYIVLNPNFLNPLDEQIWDLVERIYEENTDEGACGCLGKYPS